MSGQEASQAEGGAFTLADALVSMLRNRNSGEKKKRHVEKSSTWESLGREAYDISEK
jgi:hypothetical protein